MGGQAGTCPRSFYLGGFELKREFALKAFQGFVSAGGVLELWAVAAVAAVVTADGGVGVGACMQPGGQSGGRHTLSHRPGNTHLCWQRRRSCSWRQRMAEAASEAPPTPGSTRRSQQTDAVMCSQLLLSPASDRYLHQLAHGVFHLLHGRPPTRLFVPAARHQGLNWLWKVSDEGGARTCATATRKCLQQLWRAPLWCVCVLGGGFCRLLIR